ncbi:hypothetical protein ACFLVE_01385 [Chloroflexota bacterium]
MYNNTLEVNCYSGHTYAEEPRSFQWQGIEYEVAEIEKTWHEPGKKFFLVQTGDSKYCQLCYNELEKTWTIAESIPQGKSEGR